MPVTAKDVQRVARTGATLIHNGGRITIDQVVKLTSADDWEYPGLCELKIDPAWEIAAQFNARHPDADPDDVPEREGRRQLALTAA